MKSNDLQPGWLHPAKLSFRIEGQIKKFPRQQKANGVHQHQTSITRNVKGRLSDVKGVRGMGEKGEGMKNRRRVVTEQSRRCEVQHREYSPRSPVTMCGVGGMLALSR